VASKRGRKREAIEEENNNNYNNNNKDVHRGEVRVNYAVCVCVFVERYSNSQQLAALQGQSVPAASRGRLSWPARVKASREIGADTVVMHVRV
jgi:hypothetical protein